MGSRKAVSSHNPLLIKQKNSGRVYNELILFNKNTQQLIHVQYSDHRFLAYQTRKQK